MNLKKRFVFMILIMLNSLFYLAHGQSVNQNYVKTTSILEPVDATTYSSSSSSIRKIENITYLDGFGKTKQSNAIGQTPQGKDLVQHYENDQYGRAIKSYLPLPSNQDSGNFITNASTQISNYYQSEFLDSYPYGEIRYDNSPINRKLESASPGNTWHLDSNSDNDHTAKYEYTLNEVNEVFKITYDESNSAEPLVFDYYDANSLLKNTIKNENWKPTDGKINSKEYFTDKNGKKIAEFSFVNEGGLVKKLSTYYLYDKGGNLLYVLTPKLFESTITHANSFTTDWYENDFLQQGDAGVNKIFFSIENNLLTINTGPFMSGGVKPNFSIPTKVLKLQTVKALPSSLALPNMYLGKVMATNGLYDITGALIYQHVGNASIDNGNLVIDRVSVENFSVLQFSIIKDLNVPAVSLDNLNDLAFQYKWDKFNRQIEQKVPGKGWEYSVYDKIDRPILTQDAKLRLENKWMFNKYDVFGRVVYSGLHTNAISREELQQQVDTFILSSSNPSNTEARESSILVVGGTPMNYSNNSFPNTNIETLNVNYFDNYSFTDIDMPSIPNFIQGQAVTNNTKGLLTATWSKTLGASTWSKWYNFYDAKARVIGVHEKNHLGGITSIQSKLDFSGAIERTETKHKRLSISTELRVVDRFEYDHAQRPIKHYQKVNSQEEELISYNSYNELGQLQKKKVGGTSLNSSPTGVYSNMVGVIPSSSPTGDIILKKQSSGTTGWNAGASLPDPMLNNGYISFKAGQIDQYLMVGLSNSDSSQSYQDLQYAIFLLPGGSLGVLESSFYFRGTFGTYTTEDLLSVERIGNTVYYKKNGTVFYESEVSSTGTLIGDTSFYAANSSIKDFEIYNEEEGLQALDYNYNIRGWLTNINDVDNLGNDLFAYKLKYDEATEGSATANSMYNGNIKQIIWKSAKDNTKKSYAYQYDNLNRFSSAQYRENNTLTGGAGKFETSNLTYDFNGNIQGLTRKNNTGAALDELSYTYDNGNKLIAVSDTSGNTQGFNDGFSGTDYVYDVNGNLIKDYNKGITNIEYNHLDLVEKVTFNSGNLIEFTYNSEGVKLQMKTTLSSGLVTTTDYLGGFQYRDTQLQFFATPEGYATKYGTSFEYVYTIKDNLGSNRLSFSDLNNDQTILASDEILSTTDHYAMGLKHQGEYISGIGANYNYRFQGKEQLSFGGYNMYDFGSRMYDPATGRWFNTDPQNQFWSPYIAMGNNYVMMLDPNGEWVHILVGAVAGGVINVVSNLGNIDSIGDGLAYFGVGAASGAVTAATGNVAAGSALLAAGNSAYSQYDKTGSIDPAKLIGDTVIGGMTGAVGQKLSAFAAPYTQKLFSNVGNQVVQQYLSDAVSSTVIGVGLGTVQGLANGQSLGDSFSSAVEGIPQSLAISVIGTTGSRLNANYNKNKQAKKDAVAKEIQDGLDAQKPSPSEQARSWQGKGNYPGVDNWKDISLTDRKIIAGGLPGQSEYYTTLSAVKRSGLSRKTLFKGLQVAKHPKNGYRGELGIYRVKSETSAAFGTTYANPQFGKGGFPQIYIHDYSTKLELIRIIKLEW